MLTAEYKQLAGAPSNLAGFNQGPIPYGLYSGPIKDVSTAPWAALRRNQRKVWVYAGAFTGRYYVGFAIADAGIVATAFAYVFDSETNTYLEEKATVPFGFNKAFDPALTSNWKLKNYSIHTEGNTTVCAYKGKRLSVNMHITENGLGSTTLAPAAGRPFHHSYKNLLLPTKVELLIDGQPVAFEGNIGGIDFSKGYPPRNTFWNWASLNAVTDTGIEFGVNLVADFNNSIENALWVNGRVSQLSQAAFSYKRPIESNNTHVRTLDGILDMQFKPLGVRGESINALLMVSRFKQPFGVFNGTVLLDGQRHKFTGYGVVEEHFAKW